MRYNLRKVKWLKAFFIGSIICLASTNLSAQVTLYSEDFSNDDGIGCDNGCTAPGDGNWGLISIGSPDLTGGNDYVKVVSGALHWRDMGSSTNRVQWYSNTITGCSNNVSISTDWYTTSTWTYQRRLRFYYRIDGGAWTLYDTENYTTSGTFSGTSTITGLSFTTSFEIAVDGFMSTSDANGTFQIDNVLVTGYSCCEADPGTLSK